MRITILSKCNNYWKDLTIMGKMDVAEFAKLEADYMDKQGVYQGLFNKINDEKDDLMNELYDFSETLNLAQRISLVAELEKRDDVQFYFVNTLSNSVDEEIKTYLSLSDKQRYVFRFYFSKDADGNMCFTVKQDLGLFDNYDDGALSDKTLKKLQKLLESCDENMRVIIDVNGRLHELCDEVYGGMDIANYVDKKCRVGKLSKTYRKCISELGKLDSSE